ncbi:hypothetical protein [Streptomyces wuyuanensis]|uniref:hypothetical protein n=1 Tax=Streptomyces wuyuanensis TaxID=1196353 RepID=UPI0037A0C660
MLPENGDEPGRDRYEPDLLDRPVLETPVVVGLIGVNPLLADAGTCPEQRCSPASRRKLQICSGEADGFGGTESPVVHTCEQVDESTATCPAVCADVRDPGEQGTSLRGVGDDPWIDFPGCLGLLPADRSDRVLFELAQVHRVLAAFCLPSRQFA